MQRKTGFWKLYYQRFHSSLILLLILFLANASFQVKGMRDASLLEKGKACEGADFNYPVYLAPRVNASFIGVIPFAYGQWISCLIKENAWRTIPTRFFNLPLYGLPKASLVLLGHRLVSFSKDCLELMKIRE